MSGKKIYSILLLLALALLVSGCGSTGRASSAAKENRLVYAADTEYAGLNPILEETNVDALLFRGLMRFNEENEPVTDIAESFSVSEDGLTYTFKLKEGVTFHDGEPLTAEDVIFTIESILDDKNASFLKSDFTAVKTLTRLDDYSFELKLNEPFAPLLDKLTVPVLPKHAFNGVDMRTANFNSSPIGAGPYKFKAWERGASLTLEAYEAFHGTKPSIETVIFKFIPDSSVRALQLKSGEVDIALLDPVQAESMEKTEGITVHAVGTADYRGILYNMKNPLWHDVNVRKAFNYATDRDRIVSGILKGYGTAAYSPLQKHEYANDSIEKYTYNIQKANDLLEAAGWKKDEDGFRYKNGKRLAFTITAPVSDAVRVNTANYAAESFKAIGADVKAEALDWNAIAIEETDAFLIAWGSPYDADHHTHSVFHSGQSAVTGTGYNYGSYSNGRVDKLLEKGRTAANKEERQAAYEEFQGVLAEDPPFNFIAYTDAVYGMNSSLEGVKERTLGHHGSGFLWNVEEWKWNDR